MKILVVGINYENSPIEIRERVSFSPSALERAYEVLENEKDIREVVILSTCNRSEITAIVEDIDRGIKIFKNFYKDFFQIEEEILEKHLLVNISKDGVDHIFQLTAGLKSLVLGEDQILGQVRQAYEQAFKRGNTGAILNKLYQEAIATAKKIKRETKISQSSLSISSIAVKLIEKIFKDISHKKVMVIGVGPMSQIAIENFIDKGVKKIYITNRTNRKTMDLSQKYKGVCGIDFKDRYHMISKVDIIITSTSAPHYVLRKEEFKKYFSEEQELCIVDIAVPRDVDPEIGKMKGISLYELDQLKKVSEENMESRINAAKNAKEMIKKKSIEFEKWYHCLPIFPVIEELKKYSEEILKEEMASLMKRLEKASTKDKQLIEIVMGSLTKKLIKTPILNLKEAGENQRGEFYGEVAKKLFGIK